MEVKTSRERLMVCSFKIYFNDDVRRVAVSCPPPSWRQFVELLRGLFGPLYHAELRVQYVDEEGERISVGSEIEWEEALVQMKTQKIKKLYVIDGKKPYFKDSPPPEPQYFYNDNEGEKQVVESAELLDPIRIAIPECLQALLGGEKLLPYHLPPFLREVVAVKKIANTDDVELDINVEKLFSVVHKRALQAFDENQFPFAKCLLETLLKFNDHNPLVLYNLACAESLLGNCEQAVQLLNRAVQVREDPLQFIATVEADPDFNNLRNHAGYIQLLQTIRNQTKVKPEPENNQPKAQAQETNQNSEQTMETSAPEPVLVPVVVVDQAPSTPELTTVIKEEPPKRENDNGGFSPFEAQLKQLNEMGFFDVDRNLHLLEQYDGNLGFVVEQLCA